MILKVLARHSPSYKSLINYVLNESKSKDGIPQVIKHNIRSDDIDGYIQEFHVNEANRKYPRQGQVYLFHEIISLSSNEDPEKVNRKMLEDIANKYCELRGRDGMYLASIHEDKDHAHIHVVTSGLKYSTGMSSRMSHQELIELKLGLQSYQQNKYPELTHSICEHGSGKKHLTDRAWQKANRENRDKEKIILQETLNKLFSEAKSQKQFLESIRENNLHHYERNGRNEGIVTGNGTKYRFSRLNIDINELKIDNIEENKSLKAIEKIKEENNNSNTDMNNPLTPEQEEEMNMEFISNRELLELQIKYVETKLEEIQEQKNSLYAELFDSDTTEFNEVQNLYLESLNKQELDLKEQANEYNLNIEMENLSTEFKEESNIEPKDSDELIEQSLDEESVQIDEFKDAMDELESLREDEEEIENEHDEDEREI